MEGNPLAFRADHTEPVDVEIRVNFGMFAGREVTFAEIDDLAQDLLRLLRQTSVVALRRYELDREAEAVVHQVKVEANAADAVTATSVDVLAGRLLEICEGWARRSIELRHAETAEVEALP